MLILTYFCLYRSIDISKLNLLRIAIHVDYEQQHAWIDVSEKICHFLQDKLHLLEFAGNDPNVYTFP